MLPVRTYDPVSHTYRVNGRRWPSVTGALDPLQQLDGIPADVLKAAARFGSHVHLACHLSNLGQLDEATLDPNLAPYLAGWRLFLAESGAVVVESERQVWHPTLGYAGTFDALVQWRVSRYLVDIKTSVAVPRIVGPQTAAYTEAYRSEGGVAHRTRYCVHLPGGGKYRLHKLADPADFNVFLSALNILKWRAQLCPTLLN